MNAQDETRLRLAAEDPAALVGGRRYDPAGPALPAAAMRADLTGRTDLLTFEDELGVDRRRPWQFVAALGLAVGFAAGLLLAVALIPDQPDQVIVPVEEPAGFIAPDPGTWSA